MWQWLRPQILRLQKIHFRHDSISFKSSKSFRVSKRYDVLSDKAKVRVTSYKDFWWLEKKSYYKTKLGMEKSRCLPIQVDLRTLFTCNAVLYACTAVVLSSIEIQTKIADFKIFFRKKSRLRAGIWLAPVNVEHVSVSRPRQDKSQVALAPTGLSSVN